jgi:hypothetical protein
MGIATIITILLFAYMVRHAGQNPSYDEMGYDMCTTACTDDVEYCAYCESCGVPTDQVENK